MFIIRQILNLNMIFLLSPFIVEHAYSSKNNTIIDKLTKPATYIVINCNDGDTCRLRSSDNLTFKIRLVGIDAPETGKAKSSIPAQPFALESRDHLNFLIKGKVVHLKNYGTDQYGRNLAEIYLNKMNVNLEMVKAGYAEVYKGGNTPEGINISVYKNMENMAIQKGIGIWSSGNYLSPYVWRKKNR